MDRHLSSGAAAWPVAPSDAASLECDADAFSVLAGTRWPAVADIQKRQTNKGVRWDVRYRDDANRQRKRSFARKVDAQHFVNTVETDLLRGDWIDPRRGQELFGEWAEKWLTTIGDKKPKTRESYESIVNKHLLPRFSRVPLGAIDYPVVLAFVADLQGAGLGAGTVRNIRDVLRMVLRLAVRSGAIRSNPVTDIKVARGRHAEMVFLDVEQIMKLAIEVTAPPVRYRREERRRDGYPEYGLLVRFAAFHRASHRRTRSSAGEESRSRSSSSRCRRVSIGGARPAADRRHQDVRAAVSPDPAIDDR
jgi:hypothetical protein